MKVGIVGLGLIGGSFAWAYHNDGHQVLAFNRTRSVLDFAMLSGAVDGELTEENAGDCDLILVTLYPQAAIDYIDKMGPHFGKKPLVMDCCGTKRTVCSACGCSTSSSCPVKGSAVPFHAASRSGPVPCIAAMPRSVSPGKTVWIIALTSCQHMRSILIRLYGHKNIPQGKPRRGPKKCRHFFGRASDRRMHSLCLHTCGLSGVFSDAHVPGKHEFQFFRRLRTANSARLLFAFSMCLRKKISRRGNSSAGY